MNIIAIVGSRDFDNYELLKAELNKIEIKKIITGGAKGADSLAEHYAHEHNIAVDVYKPDWKLGRHAGILRNKVMVDNAEEVIAFWNGESYGTLSTIKYAKKTDKPVTIIVTNGSDSSDIFSNSTFIEDFKNQSLKVRTPVIEGSQTQTYWFYESIRGEYLSALVNLKPAEKLQFNLVNPKSQFIDNKILFRTESAWLQKIDIALVGVNENMQYFATYIADILDKNSLAITEDYFKKTVAKIILYKYIANQISKSEWGRIHKSVASIVYTLCYLSYTVSKTGKSLDLNQIWNSQSIPEELKDILNVTAKGISQFLAIRKEGYEFQVLWIKHEKCWDEIKALPFNIKIPESLLVDD
ncbi:MAG: AIPR family protein [Methylococcales bacterium]